jgi:predicted transposase YbfD/YdcC
VGQVCQIKRTITKQGQTTAEVQYAVTSVPRPLANAGTLLQWWRGHWGIENRVHWVRDVTFSEDASKIRTGSAPQVLAAVRNAAISLLRAQNVTNIAEAIREHAFKVQSLFTRFCKWNK